MTHRRRKLQDTSARQRGEELPWELSVPLENTYWPNDAFFKNLRSSLFDSVAVENKLESTCEVVSRSNISTTMPHNVSQSQSWLPGSSGLASTNFPEITLADIKCDSTKKETTSPNGKTLPPIGVFWDIENCSVPNRRSGLVAVQRIRQKFFQGHVEAEFLCVCDIRKESPSIIQELNDAQVSVIHVSGNSKNAADDKLRQAMRRFADISCANPVNSEWPHPATVILISGDINFVPDLSDLRHRKRLYIILLHNRQAPEALLMCAHQQYEFHSILTDLPYRSGYKDYAENSIPLKGGLSRADVILTDIPLSNNVKTQNFIRNRLKKLSENCGGRVQSIRGQWAVIRFPNYEAALRASKRMNGEDVLGNKIKVAWRQQMDFVEYQQADMNGAGPRLYSTMGSCDGKASLAHSYGWQNFNVHHDPHFKMNSTSGGSGTSANKTSSPPPGKSSVKQPFGVTTANTNGGTECYAKSSIVEGDSFNLNVTNIDPSIGDWRMIRAALTSAFADHVSVRGIWVYIANDGTATANVKLNSKDEAHYAVAQLHRRKIGNKRIIISFEQGNSVDHGTLKREVASLLQDVPNHNLPLFKFREMFEKRYKRSVSSSDLYRMKDVVTISETSPNGSGTSTSSSGRHISLASNWQSKEGKGLNLYCALHGPKTQRATEKTRLGWADKEAEVILPNVIIEIKKLGTRIHTLLQSHDGSFPLISFLDCYEAEFGTLELATEGGVPLEHLITSVQGVEIVFGENGMKRVQWYNKKEADHNAMPQPLASQLAQFGRELIDLLKTVPKCTLPFSRLIPCYHAHFGRQCRVADYGHFSLVALLQTLPHIIQIMGAAQNRVVTLSHRAQMKRFATDMLRVLKSQGGPKKQIRMDDFSSSFLNVFPQRQFQPEDYGLCFFSDLVTELVEHSTLVALVKDQEDRYWLAVPKREQTPHELYRTRLFAAEVVELLRHSARCEMEFSRFVPCYHHHFQKQCRVSDYGFSKLAELFDAIGDTITVVNPTGNEMVSEDKIIRLTPKEQIKVIGEQICNIIKKRKDAGLPTDIRDVDASFLADLGFVLIPELCGASSLEDLITNKLDSFVTVTDDGEVTPVDRVHIEDLSQKAEIILQQAEEYTLDMEAFMSALIEKCSGAVLNEAIIEKDLCQVAIIAVHNDGENEKTVSLTPLRVFAHEMTLLLKDFNGTLLLTNLENLYFEKFSRPLRPAQLGYPTVPSMLEAISDVVSVQGKQRTKRTVVLNSAKPAMESTSDDSSSTYERQTPRGIHGSHWKTKENRCQNPVSSFKQGKFNDGNIARRRRPVLPPPMFSPLASPGFPHRHAEGFTFDRPAPLTPPLYDMWYHQDSVAPGSPPISPPVVWTCHPIFYPSSSNAAGPGNILVTSPYVAPTPWSPPVMNSNCFESIPSAQPPTMLGNEYLFGQPHRLAASFEKLGVAVNDGNENEAKYDWNRI